MKKIIILLMMAVTVFQISYAETAAEPQPEDMNPEDNVTFGVQAATAGLVLGYHLNGILSPEEFNVGYQFLGGGIGAGLGVWAGWDRKVPMATSVLTGTGLYLGGLEAFLLYSIWSLEGEFTSSGLNTAMFIGGLSGSLLGYYFGENYFPEAGPAQMLALFSHYALLTSTELGVFLDWEGGNYISNLRLLMGGTALAGIGGAAAGLWISGMDHFTPGDVQVLGSVFTSGTLAGLGLAVNIPFNYTLDSSFNGFSLLRKVGAVSLASSTLSMAAGLALVWGHEYTREQGQLVSLGALAGTLAGAGVAYLAKFSKPGDYLIAQGVGALVLSGGMGFFLRNIPPAGVQKNLRSGGGSRETSVLPQVSFHPEALLGAFGKEELGKPSPLVTMAWSF